MRGFGGSPVSGKTGRDFFAVHEKRGRISSERADPEAGRDVFPFPGRPRVRKMTMRRCLASILLGVVVCSCGSSAGNYIILCAGDSLTEAGYPSLLEKMLKKDGRRVKVLNYGRSGDTSGQYLRFLVRARARLEAENPDFILLQLGTNDVRLDGDHTPALDFEKNMREIIRIFTEFRTRDGRPPRILLGTIPPVPEGIPFPFGPESTRRAVEEINPLIRAVAAEKKIPLADNHRLFSVPSPLLPDVHPSPEGYRAMAQNWRESLEPFLKK